MLHTPRPLRPAVAALTVVALAGLAGCSNDNNMPGMPSMGHSSSSTSVAPTRTASPAAGPHNDADVMFAQMMIPHHQQAIEMSDILLAQDGIDAKVTELATQIKAAQAPEIAKMSGWLAGWGQNPSPSMGMDHDTGGGMMSQADMDALKNANGAEATRLFLTGMITHHQGAITMAKQEVANGQNPEAKQLANDIIDAQQAEITTMNQLLEQL
jgi:uncharacterized protein (DUF305 family)